MFLCDKCTSRSDDFVKELARNKSNMRKDVYKLCLSDKS
jgi:hypothetical protein